MYNFNDEVMKPKLSGRPRVCVCCGGRITCRSENPNICMSCLAIVCAEEVHPPLPNAAANLNWTKSKPVPAAKLLRGTVRRI